LICLHVIFNCNVSVFSFYAATHTQKEKNPIPAVSLGCFFAFSFFQNKPASVRLREYSWREKRVLMFSRGRNRIILDDKRGAHHFDIFITARTRLARTHPAYSSNNNKGQRARKRRFWITNNNTILLQTAVVKRSASSHEKRRSLAFLRRPRLLPITLFATRDIGQKGSSFCIVRVAGQGCFNNRTRCFMDAALLRISLNSAKVCVERASIFPLWHTCLHFSASVSICAAAWCCVW
jgi:hypothetical protein